MLRGRVFTYPGSFGASSVRRDCWSGMHPFPRMVRGAEGVHHWQNVPVVRNRREAVGHDQAHMLLGPSAKSLWVTVLR